MTSALVFSDDTIISMGPETKVAIDEYLFDPLKKKLAFVTRIIHGTVSFLSGQLSKLAPVTGTWITPRRRMRRFRKENTFT